MVLTLSSWARFAARRTAMRHKLAKAVWARSSRLQRAALSSWRDLVAGRARWRALLARAVDAKSRKVHLKVLLALTDVVAKGRAEARSLSRASGHANKAMLGRAWSALRWAAAEEGQWKDRLMRAARVASRVAVRKAMAGWLRVVRRSREAVIMADLAFGAARGRLLANVWAAWVGLTSPPHTEIQPVWSRAARVQWMQTPDCLRQRRLLRNALASLLEMVRFSRAMHQRMMRSVACPALPPRDDDKSNILVL